MLFKPNKCWIICVFHIPANKSFPPLWTDIFRRNLLCKMLLYPLHCRLPPPHSNCDCSQMVKVILTHLDCFDLKHLLTHPPLEFKLILSLQTQPLCKDSESKLSLFQTVRLADSWHFESTYAYAHNEWVRCC